MKTSIMLITISTPVHVGLVGHIGLVGCVGLVVFLI